MEIDNKFETYFKKSLKQVFLYITNTCRQGCTHCLYKTTLGSGEITKDQAIELIRLFYSYGARKITFIGGEPTEYDRINHNEALFKILKACRDTGYKHIRIDTNGMFNGHFLERLKKDDLADNIAFSLEGPSERTNDTFRGKGSFTKCVESIKKAVMLGLNVSVTTCVNELTICRIEELIDFVESLGVKELNFHPLFKMGIPRDDFSGGLHLEPEQWIKKYRELFRNSQSRKYNIKLRLPQRFVDNHDYNEDESKYNYCPVRLGERILVFPDGTLRICALCIGSKFNIGKYNGDKIIWNNDPDTSETTDQRLERTPCATQQIDHPGLVNLCISYKPCQEEFVWNEYEYNKLYC